MNMMLCELTDFKTIRATVQYDHEEEKNNPVFVALIGSQEVICEIAKQEDKTNLTQYELLLPFDLSLDALRQKIEVMIVTTSKKVSKIRLKKTKVIDHYAEKVKEIDFFPQIKKKQTCFKLFPLWQSGLQSKYLMIIKLKNLKWNMINEDFGSNVLKKTFIYKNISLY
ncbi:MAG: hypothetical protein ACLFQE_04260 [Thermotogota bacterium]